MKYEGLKHAIRNQKPFRAFTIFRVDDERDFLRYARELFQSEKIDNVYAYSGEKPDGWGRLGRLGCGGVTLDHAWRVMLERTDGIYLIPSLPSDEWFAGRLKRLKARRRNGPTPFVVFFSPATIPAPVRKPAEIDVTSFWEGLGRHHGPECVTCGTLTHDAGPVLWKCAVCGGPVCCRCTKTIGNLGKEYHEMTLCSVSCWERAGRPDE